MYSYASIQKEKADYSPAFFVCSYVSEDDFFALVHDPFYLPGRHIEFLGERFVTDSVNEPSVNDFSIAFIKNVFIDRPLYLAS